MKEAIQKRLVWNSFEWKKWWSMRLVIASAIFSSISAAYLTFPSDWLPAISVELKAFFAYGSLITAASAGVARVIKQPNTTMGGS